MTTSEQGKQFIKTFEQCRLSVYLDAGDKPTIGWGHLVRAGDDVNDITQQEADELFDADVERIEKAVNKLLKRPLSQHEYDAVVSFTFNLGVNNLRSSTLLKRINSVNSTKEVIAFEFLRWVFVRNARNQVMKLRGLVRRRKYEAKMYTEGSYVLEDKA